MNKEEIKQKVEIELKKREKSIRNKHAFEKLLELLPPLDSLWGMVDGVNGVIEFERQKLTLDMVLDLIIGLDDKLSGKDLGNMDAGLKILIENVIAEGNITGLEGKTSDKNIQKIFEKPLSVEIKNSQAKGDVTGIKLNVDARMPIKGHTKVKNDIGEIEIDPSLGEVVLGDKM